MGSCFHYRMFRTYKRKPDSNRQNNSNEDVTCVLLALYSGNEKLRTIANRHGIPMATLWRQWKGRNPIASVLGHTTALLQGEERAIASNAAALGHYGLTFTTEDLRPFVKRYLDKKGHQVACFKDNLSGIDWCLPFLKRHKNILSNRHCQNISLTQMMLSRSS